MGFSPHPTSNPANPSTAPGFSGLWDGEEDKLQMMLVAYLLNQVMDELGDQLQLHSENVRAPLQAIIHLTDEQMLLHITGASDAKAPGQ